MALVSPATLPPITCIKAKKNSFSSSLNFTFHLPHQRSRKHVHLCKASSSSTSSPITEFDLYELLGIDKSSDQKEIKRAYRSLQKKCHPDVAGAAGHEMAIILNEVYRLLSDPISRSAYDKELTKTSELQGYTGSPMYSVWMGPQTEQRAVFVDELKCVGCLKCALLAEKTFAIESVYGRARVVAQWANSEDKIQESIDACPVSCISMVERSDLAALEFLMSKQPRGRVRIGASGTVGERSFDVFSELKIFQKRLEQANTRKSNQNSQYSSLQNEARIAAVQSIRSISNWFYWMSPSSSESFQAIVLRKGVNKSIKEDINKLRDAAAKIGDIRFVPQTKLKDDEYWTPASNVLSSETNMESSHTPTIQRPPTQKHRNIQGRTVSGTDKHKNVFAMAIPMELAFLAAAYVRLNGVGEGIARLDEHVGGSFALQIINSSWLPAILAGATWYVIGMAVTELVVILGSKSSK